MFTRSYDFIENHLTKEQMFSIIFLERRIPMDDQLMKPAEVAEMLKVSTATAYTLLQRGEIPSVRIGSLVRVRRGDLEKYIQGKRTEKHSKEEMAA
jgi:excisionase family DNA binding protein